MTLNTCPQHHETCTDPGCPCPCHKAIGPTKQRDGDQPLPKTNKHPFVADALKDFIEARKQVGIQRYGTPLQPHNGRDALRDAFEEAVDLATYLAQILIERDGRL